LKVALPLVTFTPTKVGVEQETAHVAVSEKGTGLERG
jgi:hypothetical protein